MDADTLTKQFSTRALIHSIRAELKAVGRPDVGVERNWIELDKSGSFFLRVPVGTVAVVPVTPGNEADEINVAVDQEVHAAHLAEALVNLKKAEPMLVKYASDIHRAANAAVEAARADGCDILLEKVGFRPVNASQLTGTDWKQAAHHVRAAVTVRHTSSYLRAANTTFWVEGPADVAKEMADIRAEQRFRQIRVAQLEAVGADFLVDEITLDLIAAHGLDAGEILAGMTNVQSASIPVQYEGHDVPLSLTNHHGEVTASLAMPDAVWNGDYLRLLGEEEMKDHRHLIGKSLGELIRHPVFASRSIADVVSGHADRILFKRFDKALFDAESRRIWRDATLGGLIDPAT